MSVHVSKTNSQNVFDFPKSKLRMSNLLHKVTCFAIVYTVTKTTESLKCQTDQLKETLTTKMVTKHKNKKVTS